MAYEIVLGREKGEKEKHGIEGTILLGKHYVKMGEEVTLAQNIYLDVNKAHVVFVAGKRGCLEGNTLILTDKGYKKIKEFNKENMVLSFNKEKKKFEWEHAELLKYPLKNEKLLRIELKDGRSLILTEEHPLLSSYGKYLYYREAKNLRIGDKIAIPTALPEIKSDRESLRIARLLGYILADGTIGIRKGRFKDGRGYWYNGTKARIRIFNQSEEILTQAKADLEKEFSITAKRYKRKDCNCEVIETKQQKIANTFIELGVPKGLKSGIIRIPKIVFESSNKFKSEFISALFDCDGFIDPRPKTIDYSSKSREFLEDLQLLLTHFNIESVIRNKNSKIKNKTYKNYRLFITDNVSIENFKKIGFKNKFKQERLNKHKSNKTRKRRTHYINDNLACIKINSIKTVEGVEDVYDLTVPKNHSFIAKGIISHNSGKSYSLAVIAEGIKALPKEIGKKISVILLDTMGIYWTMKYPNNKDIKLLKEWGLKPEKVDITIYTPEGHFEDYKAKKIPTDKPFSIKPSELNPEDWWNAFELHMNDPLAVYIERIILTLQNKQENFSIKDIIHFIQHDEREEKHTRQAAINRFTSAEQWGLFSEKGTPIKELVKGGEITVLDMSPYAVMPNGWKIKCLAMGFVCSKLFIERMKVRKEEEQQSIQSAIHFVGGKKVKSELPNVWICIDECHEFLPRTGKTGATDSLLTLLREGRQPGIALVLATQQPGKIHTDAMTQSDVILAHKLTAKVDTEALGSLMQSYLRKSLDVELQYLPGVPGACLAIDDVNEKIFPMRVKPKLSWHGGGAPDLLEQEKGFLS